MTTPKAASNRRRTRATAGAFLIIGCGLITVAGFLSVAEIRFINRAVVSKGVITAHDYVSRSGRSGGYYPLIQTIAPDGRIVKFRASVGSQNPNTDYPLGAEVGVYVDAEGKEQPQLIEFRSQWLLPTILAMLGVVFAATAGLIRRYGNRAARRIEDRERRRETSRRFSDIG